METKTCTKCHEEKPLSDFYPSKRDGYRSHCIACSKSISAQRYIDEPLKLWANGTMGSHKRRGFIVTITRDQLVDIAKKTTHCSICGCKLKWEKHKGMTCDSPTLDRIHNEQELNTDNIWIVCNQCNAMKGETTMKDLINKCKRILEMHDATE